MPIHTHISQSPYQPLASFNLHISVTSMTSRGLLQSTSPTKPPVPTHLRVGILQLVNVRVLSGKVNNAMHFRVSTHKTHNIQNTNITIHQYSPYFKRWHIRCEIVDTWSSLVYAHVFLPSRAKRHKMWLYLGIGISNDTFIPHTNAIMGPSATRIRPRYLLAPRLGTSTQTQRGRSLRFFLICVSSQYPI
jgi:hypothetical protein